MMSKTAHRIFIGILVAIVFIATIAILYKGKSYYRLSLEERVYHPDHSLLKPSGIVGHGLGIVGSLLMIIGMTTYMARKRYRALSRLGSLKNWLEFHIFLCTLGPIMVLFHTAYKFGGLVAVSFWSMVAVFLSGIIGRFIYIQIPRSIEGRELSLNEVRAMKGDVAGLVRSSYNMDEESYNIIVDSIKKKVELYHKNSIVRYIRKYFDDRRSIKAVKIVLKRNNLPKREYNQILSLVNDDIMLNRKIERLDTMQNLFKYWHVAHLPFALVMLIIMVIHVAVTIVFGYRWIF
jgi:sulfur relay (sulfurtransferase) DsrC/TusE family protein